MSSSSSLLRALAPATAQDVGAAAAAAGLLQMLLRELKAGVALRILFR